MPIDLGLLAGCLLDFANIDLAIRVQTVISLAEIADRMKITCLFDEKARKITDASGKQITPFTYGTAEKAT